MDLDDISIRAMMVAAGMTPQSRARRNLIGRFRVGGPRLRRVPGQGNQTDGQSLILDRDTDGTWRGVLASRSRERP